MQHIIFDIRIDKDEYLKHYSGAARYVNARARDGRRVQFPASALRPFVTHNGVEGSFVATIDNNAKLLSFRRL